MICALLGAPLVSCHDGRALVLASVLIPDDADEEAVSERQRVAEQRLVSDVAKVVHPVAVDVDANAQKMHVSENAQGLTSF